MKPTREQERDYLNTSPTQKRRALLWLESFIYDHPHMNEPRYARDMIKSALEAQPVDIEELKQSDTALDDYNHAGKARVKGWNDCIDHLAATGRLSCVSKQPENEKQDSLSLETTDQDAALLDAYNAASQWVQNNFKNGEERHPHWSMIKTACRAYRKALNRPAVPFTEISIDVSTGDHDHGVRAFAKIPPMEIVDGIALFEGELNVRPAFPDGVSQARKILKECFEKQIAIPFGELDKLLSYTKPTYKIADGWKVVPIDPTDEMIDAGSEQYGAGMIWEAMIEAAPKQGDV